MLVLARVLSDEDYGQFAFVMSLIGFITIFSAQPFLSYTLQVSEEKDVHYQDHFTASAVLQFLLFLVTNLAALIVLQIPSFSSTAPLIHVMSLTFLLEWTCELRRKMIEREFDFVSLRLLHGIGLTVSVVIAIAMALAGCGAYALVIPGMLVTIPFILDLFYRKKWRPTWEFSWVNYRDAFKFGTTRIGSGISVKGRTLLEATVLAGVLGFGPLGTLNRAVGLAMIACGKLATQLTYAIYPVLTRLSKESGQAARAGNLVLRLIAWSAIPSAVALATLSMPVVDTIYGEKWSEVAPLLKWTLVCSVCSALVQVGYTLVLARDRSTLCFFTDFLVFGGTAIGLVLVLPFGVIPYLIFLAVTYLIVWFILLRTLFLEQAISISGVSQALLPAIVGSLSGFLLAFGCSWAIGIGPINFWAAVFWGCIFALTYAATLRIVFADPLCELLSFFPAKNSIGRLLFLPNL